MKKFVTILSFLLAITLLQAGDTSRKGTTGAEQLLIPVGARSIATAGAFIANTTGVEAIYYNPAGLAVSGKSELMISYMDYLADLNVTYLAAAANLGEFGAIGFTYKSLDFGDIPVTTVEAPDGTGASYSPGFYTVGLTYSKVITDRVAFGVNFKYIHEGIMSTSAEGAALDFGVQYTFSNNLFLGVAVKNIGTNMSYSGQDLQVKTNVPNSRPGSQPGAFTPVTEEFQIPSYFELSMAYRFDFNAENNLLLGTSFRNNNAMEDQVIFGMEYAFMQNFFLRGGYDLLMQNMDDHTFGFTFGAGVNYSLSDNLGFVFDYAYREVKEFPDPNHIFTLKLALQ